MAIDGSIHRGVQVQQQQQQSQQEQATPEERREQIRGPEEEDRRRMHCKADVGASTSSFSTCVVLHAMAMLSAELKQERE